MVAAGLYAYSTGWMEIQFKNPKHAVSQSTDTVPLATTQTGDRPQSATTTLNASLLDLQVNLPADIPYWSNGKVTYSTSNFDPAKKSIDWFLIEKIPEPSARVVEFYKTQLAAQGWAIDSASTYGNNTHFQASKNSRVIRLDIKMDATEVNLWWSI